MKNELNINVFRNALGYYKVCTYEVSRGYSLSTGDISIMSKKHLVKLAFALLKLAIFNRGSRITKQYEDIK